MYNSHLICYAYCVLRCQCDTYRQFVSDNLFRIFFFFFFPVQQRPPSSSLSYGGAMNDDARSPGSGSTPGPLSAQPPPGLDTDPGMSTSIVINIKIPCATVIAELMISTDVSALYAGQTFNVYTKTIISNQLFRTHWPLITSNFVWILYCIGRLVSNPNCHYNDNHQWA